MGFYSRFMPIKSYVKVKSPEEFTFIYDTYLEGKNVKSAYHIDFLKERKSLFPVYIFRSTNGYRVIVERKDKELPIRYKTYLNYTNAYKIKIAMEL